MQVALIAAVPSDEPMLSRLKQLYVYDFSEIMPVDVGEDGVFVGGTSISSCWVV